MWKSEKFVILEYYNVSDAFDAGITRHFQL